jgi:N-methylhydantoinase B
MLVSGGGGFGDPLERSPAAVADDIAAERYSADTAYEVYGCLLDDKGNLDTRGTTRRRDGLRAERLRTARPVMEIFTEAIAVRLGGAKVR